MRLLRNLLLAIFAVLAVLGGLFFAIGLAIVGGLAAALARLLRPGPRVQPPRTGGDVIDVAATEVKSPPLLR